MDRISPRRVNGVDLATRLSDAAYGGVICLMTGSTGADMERLRSLPLFDLVFDKGVSIAELRTQVVREIETRGGAPRRRGLLLDRLPAPKRASSSPPSSSTCTEMV